MSYCIQSYYRIRLVMYYIFLTVDNSHEIKIVLNKCTVYFWLSSICLKLQCCVVSGTDRAGFKNENIYLRLVYIYSETLNGVWAECLGQGKYYDVVWDYKKNLGITCFDLFKSIHRELHRTKRDCDREAKTESCWITDRILLCVLLCS